MKKQIVLFSLILLIFTFFCLTANAQSERERQVLNAFYSKTDLTVSASRYPKPITQSAENIIVVTSEEIEAMNAHTVAEVLNRLPGLFVNFSQEFGANSLIEIQGSVDRHVLVLLDGVEWNFLGGGNAETNTIPVGIIKRIEIIKGPASSVWGSSLGGIINIITKDTGSARSPTGTVRLSAGEATSLDYSADLAGKTSALGYYLYAGHQESDGLKNDRDYENNRFFSKFELPVSEVTTITVDFGYSEPDNHLGEFPNWDIKSRAELETYYAKSTFDTRLSNSAQLQFSCYYISQDLELNHKHLGLTPVGQLDDLYEIDTFDEKVFGGTGKLIWKKGNHSIVSGLDFFRGDLDQTISAGKFLQAYGVPAKNKTTADLEKSAFYLNDTFLIGRWAITPGFRFDDNSVSGNFFSPSLGVTYRLDKNVLLRATVSRGFHYPSIAPSQTGVLFLDPNPSLEAEEVWSYQAGFEATVGSVLWFKTNLFLHDQRDSFERTAGGGGPPNYNDLTINGADLERRGVEFELKTLPIFNVSFAVNGTYVHLSPSNESGTSEEWSGGVLVEYNDRRSVYAQLSGRYSEWDLYPWYRSAEDLIWDFNFNKKFFGRNILETSVFITVHNILNGSQYNSCDRKNPSRWIEAGLQWRY